jgi:hypothetical protein
MMTDAEVRQQIDRADCFIEQLRDAITATVVDRASLCGEYRSRRTSADRLDAGRRALRNDEQSVEH